MLKNRIKKSQLQKQLAFCRGDKTKRQPFLSENPGIFCLSYSEVNIIFYVMARLCPVFEASLPHQNPDGSLLFLQ